MNTIATETYILTYPGSQTFTNSPFAYIKFALKSQENGIEVKLTISALVLNIKRVTDTNGSVIFPLRDILEYQGDLIGYVECESKGIKQTIYITSPIKGYSDQEISLDNLAPVYNRPTYNIWPKKIIVYPKLNGGDESIKLLCGDSTSNEFGAFLKTDYLVDIIYNWTFGNPDLTASDKMGVETTNLSKVYYVGKALTVFPGVVYESGLLKLPEASNPKTASRYITFKSTYGGTLTIEHSSMNASDASRNTYVGELAKTSFPNFVNIQTINAPAGNFAKEQITVSPNCDVFIWVDGGISFKSIEFETKKRIKESISYNLVKTDSNFLDFPINLYLDTDWEKAIAIGLNSYNYEDIDYTYNFPVIVDFCTNGCFLKWVDKHGFEFTYRWSVESSSEKIDAEDSYVQMNALLQPIEHRTKTIAKRTILHSRKVEQDIFDLCKSVIGCQEVRMFNAETQKWEPCFIDDSQADDSGEILKDLIITVVKYEYL